MEFTVNQALRRAIEAHKAGQIQEADRLYTAILAAQPKHPDANHNLGLLAISVGKLQEALPFLATALENNPGNAQFWLSYITALIKLDRYADAKALLDQAKSKGANGDGFEKVEKRINEAETEYSSNTAIVKTSETKQRHFLDKAIQLRENGEFNQAIDLLIEETNRSPEDADILALLSHCCISADRLEEAKRYLGKATKIAPENMSVGLNTARIALKEKFNQKALNVTRGISRRFPANIEVMGVLGACLRANGEMVESLEISNRAIELNPNYAEALINRGLIRLSQENKSEALADLEKAHKIKPHIKQIWELVIGLKIEAKHYSEAISLLIKMIDTCPEDEKRWAELALCYQLVKDFKSSEMAYTRALAIKPDYAEALYNNADVLKELDKLDEAADAYKKAVAIRPDYAEAYTNMCIILKEQGKLEEAIDACEKSIAMAPDSPEAHNNMGVILKEQGKLEEAMDAYRKAIDIKPDHSETYNNMGVILKEQGKLEEAMGAYKKAIDIKPDYAIAMENVQSLEVQLLPIIDSYNCGFDSSNALTKSDIELRPKYQIQNAIKAYLEGDFVKAAAHNNNFMDCDQNLLAKLAPKDKIFCNAYSSFIQKLLDAKGDVEHVHENKVYHLGESHCLSYAHRNIKVGGSNFRIVPRIIFGAKAFHLSRNKYDDFKAITETHFTSLPKNSMVFLSFGEIDCRPNEGFISAHTKYDKPLEELVDQTVDGYVKWFSIQNADQKHKLYFFNVPAPVYNNKHSAQLNSKVARTVVMFNTALKKYSLQNGFDMLDVYKFTAGKEGFSNSLFHIDSYHLGAKALVEIQRQLF